MGPGSGKTQIAKLRIEAELARSPSKKIWFSAPSVVLAHQQYRFLSRQLPAYQFKLITGHDNPEHWDFNLWGRALLNVQVIVSTPVILEQALNHVFVSLKDLSLLVIDEAHHCVGRASGKSTMINHYYPLLDSAPDQVPHILGLSASPITKKRTTEVLELEKNLNATCMSPIQQVEEYASFVNVAELVLLLPPPASRPTSTWLKALSVAVSSVDVEHDPLIAYLRLRNSPASKQKLENYIAKGRSPAIEELKKFYRSCEDTDKTLGSWACEMYIRISLIRVLKQAQSTPPINDLGTPRRPEDICFIAEALRPLAEQILAKQYAEPPQKALSAKVDELIRYLDREFESDLRILVFVKTRVTAWCLTEIINTHALLQIRYSAFCFVGVSNPNHGSVFDFANLRTQQDNLEAFRKGDLNVCVATSVLEEGVDVPAMNLVICFDERPNFRSFIQSRGRARKRGSRFVLFPEAIEKKQKWTTLEAEMQAECEKAHEALKSRHFIEDQEEEGGEVYRVEVTG
jgi:ERCC4-related helicase